MTMTMTKLDITRQILNLERALTAMSEDSRIASYHIDNMAVSKQGCGYAIYITVDRPECK